MCKHRLYMTDIFDRFIYFLVKNCFRKNVALYVLLFCVFCAVLCICLSTGGFVLVPLNLTCLHCLQHILTFLQFILHVYAFLGLFLFLTNPLLWCLLNIWVVFINLYAFAYRNWHAHTYSIFTVKPHVHMCSILKQKQAAWFGNIHVHLPTVFIWDSFAFQIAMLLISTKIC